MDKPNTTLMYLEHVYNDESSAEQFYRIKATELISDMPYLYTSHVLGAISVLENYVNCSLELAARLIKEAIENHLFDGIEPEWSSMEACEWWENLENNLTRVPYIGYRSKPNETRLDWEIQPPSKLIEN